MGGADVAGVTKLGERERPVDVHEDVFDPVDWRAWESRRSGCRVENLQGEGVTVGSQSERQVGLRGRGAMPMLRSRRSSTRRR